MNFIKKEKNEFKTSKKRMDSEIPHMISVKDGI